MKKLTIGGYWLEPEEKTVQKKKKPEGFKSLLIFNSNRQMKKIVLILDPPHGKEVLGKRSPDGKHEE